MEDNEMLLVEVFYKSGRKNKRVFSFVSRRDNPVPSNIYNSIEYGVEREFSCGVTYEQLSFRITEIN